MAYAPRREWGISDKSFILLASLSTSSLNHFTENMARAEALTAEIAIITNDLPATSPAQEVTRGTAPRQKPRRSR